MWGERERKSKRKNSSEICRTNTTFDFGAAYVEERDKIRCVGKENFSFLFFQRCNKKNSLLLVERADAVSLETPVPEKSRRDVVGERLLDLGPNAEPWANQICSHSLKFSNGCWYFQGICIFEESRRRSKHTVFCSIKRPLGTEGWCEFGGLMSPRSPVESRNVRELLWLRVPQEPPVNLKAPTSGYSLPLFALSSAHRRPPWLRIQGWPSLLCAWPGEVGNLQAHLVQGWDPLRFQLAFVFVSVTPFERGFCGSKCTFIILSPLFIPSPAGINCVPAETGPVLHRDTPNTWATQQKLLV